MRRILIIIIFWVTLPLTAIGSENGGEILDRQLKALNLDEINKSLEKGGLPGDISFSQLIKQSVNGELDLSLKNIASVFLRTLFSEIYQSAGLLKELLLIGALSAVLRALTDSFKNKAAGEMGFYVSYIGLITVLLASFKTAYGILEGLMYRISDFINAAIPLMTSLIVMGGSPGGGYGFNTLLFFSINLGINVVKNIIAPLILATAAVTAVNYSGEGQPLTNMAKLLKEAASWSLKGIALAFMGILSLQRISAPLINNAVMKTAKNAVDVVPVVGEILSGAVDSFLYWAKALKSGAGAAIVIALLAVCALPLIKLLAITIMYKLTAALIQPICDKRVTECINAVGDYTGLLLSAGFITAFMFIFSVVIMISF